MIFSIQMNSFCYLRRKESLSNIPVTVHPLEGGEVLLSHPVSGCFEINRTGWDLGWDLYWLLNYHLSNTHLSVLCFMTLRLNSTDKTSPLPSGFLFGSANKGYQRETASLKEEGICSLLPVPINVTSAMVLHPNSSSLV